MVVLQLTLAALCLTLAATEVRSINAAATCAERYSNTLENLLTMKENCGEPIFKDCCQTIIACMDVSTLAHTKVAKFFRATGESGVYNISNVCPTGPQPFFSIEKCVTVLQALCDMETYNGGWLVILKRKPNVSPLVNFTRTWTEYENGFGNIDGEFWYGLKNIHCLTQRDDMELKFEMKRADGTKIIWTYQEFRVDGPESNYVLHISGGTGPNSDRMYYNNGKPFSTYDQENEPNNCANQSKSGWWFENCSYTYLTNPHASGAANVRLTADNGANYFPEVEMKVRPKSCI